VPNIALVEVLLPDSATPIQPSTGATDVVGALVEGILKSKAVWVDREGNQKPITLNDVIHHAIQLADV
jgi:hypothetical protein